jgi:osmotically-inducible protein OsmY
VGRIFPQLVICLFAVTLVAGQNTRPPAGPDNSTVRTDKGKPDAGIPLTSAERRKKDDPADRRIAQQIRRAMTNDRSLSVYAGNVMIICQNGIVTLRGPVGSGEEKRNLEGKAADVAGSNHVKSELAVRPSN